MKVIKLTKGRCAIIDDADLALVSSRKWSFGNETGGYARRNDSGKTVFMHKVIMGVPNGVEVDHMDGDKLNNRRSNMRVATHQQNSFNTKLRSNSSTGIKGVSWYKRDKKWRAYIVLNGKQIHLGYHDTAQAAKDAYAKAAKEIHGEFARLK